MKLSLSGKRILGKDAFIKTKKMDGWNLLMAKVLDDSLNVDKFILSGRKEDRVKRDTKFSHKPERNQQIKRLIESGFTYKYVADRFKISKQRVHEIVNQVK